MLLFVCLSVVDPHDQSSCHPPAASVAPASSDLLSAPPLRRRKERPQVLNFSEVDMAGVLRPKPGRLDSPSNRYAGDWSTCGENYFPSEMLPANKEEVDYDDVPSEDTEAAEEVRDKQEDTADEDKQETVPSSASDPAEKPQKEEEVREEEKVEEMKDTSTRHSLEEEEEEEAEERRFNHILPPRLPKEHTYQAYVKIQDISPVLSNRGNLRDLQESIDTLIGNLERELNKNKLNVGY